MSNTQFTTYFRTTLLALALVGCRSAAPEPEPEKRTGEKVEKDDSPGDEDQTGRASASGAQSSAVPASHWEGTASSAQAESLSKREAMRQAEPPRKSGPATARVPVSPDDPLKGEFSLDQATAGLAGTGDLMATIATEVGTLTCELYADRAPITVANFVGLARGLRPFKDPSGAWVKKPGYDGTVFHRIVKGFMIQGGDPSGTGRGEPGYVIPDEIWPGAKHDRRGLLCMANRGKNTNGMQFFIMDGRAKHLDGGYTVFGMCQPEATIEKLSGWKVEGDRAVNPPKIEKVTIQRAKK